MALPRPPSRRSSTPRNTLQGSRCEIAMEAGADRSYHPGLQPTSLSWDYVRGTWPVTEIQAAETKPRVHFFFIIL